LCIGSKKGHDPKNIVSEHIKAIKLSHQVFHQDDFAEDLFRGALYFEEVMERLPIDSTREKI
jgi:hypothetical protein